MTSAQRGLNCLLDPASIAIVGASDNPDKIGGRPIFYMRRHGYAGKIYPINPQRPEVQGERTWPTLADLPEAPDAAIVAVAGDMAVQAVDACIEKGVGAAIVIAAGFSETGAAGRALQDAMANRARAAGMRIVGPNSQGLANFGNGAVACFSTMFMEMAPADGPVAVLSQSGGMSAMVYGLLRQRGIGVRHVHATGNEADVTVAELACAVLQDPEIRVVLLYLESLQNAGPLTQAAALARARGVPLIAVKAGRTAEGQRAAASHTGALASEDRTVEAFMERHGILRARDPHDMARYAELALKGPLPRGRRLVAVSNSGASCVLACDAAVEHGLEIAQLREETQAELARRLPGFATTSNPVDITAALLSNNGLFGHVLPIIGQDPAADMFLIDIPVAGRGYDVQTFAADTAAFARAAEKPVAVVAWQDAVAAAFRDAGLAVYADEQHAIGALAGLARLARLHAGPNAGWPATSSRTAAAGDPERGEPRMAAGSATAGATRTHVSNSGPSGLPAAAVRSGVLSEADSLALLHAQGLPVVRHGVCASADEAVAAWRELNGPIALKACSAAIPHKSEHGLVALGLDDEQSIREAVQSQARTLQLLGVRDAVWIVARMLSGLHECVLGMHRDPVFGPVIVLGSGGKYVEALGDVAVLLPPFSVEEATQKIDALRIGALLRGVRGEPPADVDALARMAVQLAQYALHAPVQLQSIDINPVLLRPRGEGAVALDALVEFAHDRRDMPGDRQP
jgi:acyl-CoA synthetase (NDP forming)